MDDSVQKTVFQQEFGALKSFGEFLADGLLDHARTGKPDERAGFPDVEVAEHGEAGGDAAGSGIGEHRDIGQLFVVEPGQGGRYFRELDRKSTRLNSSHQIISYAVFCLKKK